MVEQLPLGSLCEITSSKRIFAEEYVEEGIPFYRSKEIIERNNNQSITDPLFIAHSKFEEIKTRFGVPSSGDILLTSVGTLGVPYRVKETDLFYFKDGNLTWMRNFSSNLDSQYLYYWLSSSFGKQSLIQKAIGSSQPALTIEILKKYKLPVPPLPTQQKIASILSAYDSQIENNQKRIKLLEQMAENLYKEWFVRFRFPGYESAEFEGGVPKGWKFGKLRDIAQDSGKSEKKENRENYSAYVPIDCIGGHSMVLCNIDTIENAESSLVSFKKTDILFGAMRPYFHKVIMAPFSGLTRSTCFVVSPQNESYRYYLYLLLFQKTSIDYATTVSVGSTMPYTNWKDFSRMPIVIPSKDIVETYAQMVKPIIKSIESIYFSNIELVKQRDLLLPRLMSGKLSI